MQDDASSEDKQSKRDAQNNELEQTQELSMFHNAMRVSTQEMVDEADGSMLHNSQLQFNSEKDQKNSIIVLGNDTEKLDAL